MNILKQEFNITLLEQYLPKYQSDMIVVGYCKEGNTLDCQTFKVMRIDGKEVELAHLPSDKLNKLPNIRFPITKNAIVYNTWSLCLFESVEKMMEYKAKTTQLNYFDRELKISSDQLVKALNRDTLSHLQKYHLQKHLNFIHSFLNQLEKARVNLNKPLQCPASFEHITDLLFSLPISQTQHDSLFNQYSEVVTRQHIANVELTIKAFDTLLEQTPYAEPSICKPTLAYSLNNQMYIITAITQTKTKEDYILSGKIYETGEVVQEQSLKAFLAKGAILDVTHLPYHTI